MADHEVSKIMWVAIVVALAASIFTIAKPEVKTLAGGVFDKVEEVVTGTNTGDSNNENGDRPDYDDAKWVVKGNYGAGGRYVMDAKGNAIIYANDASKPISIQGDQLGTANESLNSNQKAKLTTITYLDPIVISGELHSSFSYMSDVTEIKGLDKWDTSGVTSMLQVFSGMASLTSLDVSHFNTSNVTNMVNVFAFNDKLTSVNMSNWDLSKVTKGQSMFQGSPLLTKVTVDNVTPSHLDIAEILKNANATLMNDATLKAALSDKA